MRVHPWGFLAMLSEDSQRHRPDAPVQTVKARQSSLVPLSHMPVCHHHSKSIAFENKAQRMRGLRAGSGVRMPVTFTLQTVEAKAQAGPHGSRTQSGSAGPLKGLAPVVSPRLPRL